MEQTDQQPQIFPLSKEELKAVWPLQGECADIQTVPSGHIHQTWVSVWIDGETQQKYIHQKINDYVFPNLTQLTANFLNGINALHDSIKSLPLRDNECFMEPILSRNHELIPMTTAGKWRTSCFIDSCKTFDIPPNDTIAYEAGMIAGLFLRRLSAANPNNFPEVIERFHDASLRLEQLEIAQKNASPDRLSMSKEILSTISALQTDARKIRTNLEAGVIPWRVTHNDLKLNNILFDEKSLKARSVVDLDLIQKGSSLFDFGDLVRGAAFKQNEDAQNDSEPDRGFSRALIAGFAEFQRGLLSKSEIELLGLAPFVLAFTLGVRFLSDFLSNDRYFKIDYETHNFDRANAQLKRAGALYRVRGEFQKEIRKCF